MSLIIAVYVEEGIVLASDSRTTYNTIRINNPDGTVSILNDLGIHFTESTNKTFLCPNNIGVSTCGEASISGKPITGYIETFIREKINEKTDIDDVPKLLIDYFCNFNPVPDTVFFVAGYHKDNEICEQRIWKVFILKRDSKKLNTALQGAEWNGDYDTLSRLFTNVYVKQDNDTYIELHMHQINWGFFTLQDAIDFARYAIKTVIDTMKFQSRIKTVGEPIDILVLKPKDAFWISKKGLH